MQISLRNLNLLIYSKICKNILRKQAHEINRKNCCTIWFYFITFPISIPPISAVFGSHLNSVNGVDAGAKELNEGTLFSKLVQCKIFHKVRYMCIYIFKQ